MTDTLYIDLDNVIFDGYIFTEYDIGGRCHSVTIEKENKKDFIKSYLEEVKKRLENHLVEGDE